MFLYPELCEQCGTKICIEACSGQAIAPGEGGVPAFDREIGFGLVVTLTTYLSLVIGELVPKRIALSNPERIAMRIAAASGRPGGGTAQTTELNA